MAIFYHGTSMPLRPGDKLLPPSLTGTLSEKGRKKNIHRVFFTQDRGSARIYAGRAANSLGGAPRLLVIQPVGEVVCLNPNPGTTVYHASEAVVVEVIEG
jgi:hypothetical protein